MKIPLQRKIDIIFLGLSIIFSGLFLVVFESLKLTRESSNLVSQTQDKLYQVERIIANTVDIETAHRGFAITGKDIFLENLDSAKYEIATDLKKLKNNTDGNTLQAKRIDSLYRLIKHKIELSNHGISLRRKDMNRALDLVSSGRGKIIMDSIRTISKSFQDEEIAILNSRTSENEDNILANYRNFLIFGMFSITLMFIFYSRIRENAIQLLKYRNKQDELIKELNYQNKQLDDFAHITSHNIRSPASNIHTLISLLNENSSIDEFKMIYEKLSIVSKNLNETLNELVEVLQVKKDVGIEKQILSFEEMYTKVVDSLQGEILKHNVIISTDFSEVSHIIYPRTYLESIFHNLISNAIKYKGYNRIPEIHIKSFIKEDGLYLSVKDNGLGIDMKLYGEKLFGLRKTFHAHNEAKGIGLFMTKAQIEALGGKIFAESEVAKGSTFTVKFKKEYLLHEKPINNEEVLV